MHVRDLPPFSQMMVSVELALAQRNWYCALALALALPDMLGWARDPNASGQERYRWFFEATMANLYIGPAGPMMTWQDFYALRCALLHQGQDNVQGQRVGPILERFILTEPIENGPSVHRNGNEKVLRLQVDALCREILAGAGAYFQLAGIEPQSLPRLESMMRFDKFPPGQITL